MLPAQAGFAYQLALSELPIAFPKAPPQSVQIEFGRRYLAPAIPHADSWNTFTLDLPAWAVRNGLNGFRLRYAYARAPRDVLPRPAGGSDQAGDPRNLSAAFD